MFFQTKHAFVARADCLPLLWSSFLRQKLKLSFKSDPEPRVGLDLDARLEIHFCESWSRCLTYCIETLNAQIMLWHYYYPNHIASVIEPVHCLSYLQERKNQQGRKNREIRKNCGLEVVMTVSWRILEADQQIWKMFKFSVLASGFWWSLCLGCFRLDYITKLISGRFQYFFQPQQTYISLQW